MEKRPSSSICSMIEQQLSSQQPLNQTSIRNFFVLKGSTAKQKNSSTSNKRPILSTQSLTTSQKLSTDLSTSESSVPRTNDAQEYYINSRPISACSTNVSIESCVPEPLNDSTIHYMNTMNKRSKLLHTTNTSKSTTKPKGQQQLYLDFGQQNFAATNICKICGMLFVHGVQTDIQQHEKICHNYRYGVVWNTITKNDSNSQHQAQHQPRVRYEWTLPKAKKHNMIPEGVQPSMKHSKRSGNNTRTSDDLNRACVVELRPSKNGTYSNNAKLKLVRMIVDEELGFVRNGNSTKNKDEPTTYLCIVNKRVVGMVLVEEISTAYHILFDATTPQLTSEPSEQMNAGLTRSNQPVRAVMGVYQLWVHDSYRHRGIASTLVDVARKYMCFGYSSIPIHQIAFSSPTESGLAFANQYCHSTQPQKEHCNAVLVYDCC